MSYWYVATPYSRYPFGQEAAFIAAAKITARLVDAGYRVFSPITHSHPIAQFTKSAAPTSSDFWVDRDRPHMEGAEYGMIVVMLPGWDKSSGIAQEIKYFESSGRFIWYLDPEGEV